MQTLTFPPVERFLEKFLPIVVAGSNEDDDGEGSIQRSEDEDGDGRKKLEDEEGDDRNARQRKLNYSTKVFEGVPIIVKGEIW